MQSFPVAGSRFVPTVDGFIVATLPGETMRCRVERVVDADRAIVEIGMPISKAHRFRPGDKVGVRRRVEGGRDIWEVLEDRDFLADRSPAQTPWPEPKAAKPKPKKKAATRRRAG